MLHMADVAVTGAGPAAPPSMARLRQIKPRCQSCLPEQQASLAAAPAAIPEHVAPIVGVILSIA